MQRNSGRVCGEDDCVYTRAQGRLYSYLLVEFAIVIHALHCIFAFLWLLRYVCYTASFFWSVLVAGDSLAIITFSGWF